jgi:hypothetical protein
VGGAFSFASRAGLSSGRGRFACCSLSTVNALRRLKGASALAFAPPSRILPPRRSNPARLGTVGERGQEVGQLRVPMLGHEAFHSIAPALPARLAQDGARRAAEVRQDQRAVAGMGPEIAALDEMERRASSRVIFRAQWPASATVWHA